MQYYDQGLGNTTICKHSLLLLENGFPETIPDAKAQHTINAFTGLDSVLAKHHMFRQNSGT